MEPRKLTKEDLDKVRDIEGFPIATVNYRAVIWLQKTIRKERKGLNLTIKDTADLWQSVTRTISSYTLSYGLIS